MIRAIDLLQQGRNEELWQMCCGFLKLNIHEFMDIQKHLLLEQLEFLNNSTLGLKIMGGLRPQSVEEFRERVPLTTYKEYCPELIEKRENTLPSKPYLWAHTSGHTGEFPCKWIPMTQTYAEELSRILYGVGLLSCCKGWGDVSRIPEHIKLLYSVARRPYISGVFADLLTSQTPLEYMPSFKASDSLYFEERIKEGFQLAMSKGLDYFFGLSLVLVKVGESIRDNSASPDIRPYLGHPAALFRLARGLLRCRAAKRSLLPKDLWTVRGIIGSGIDSSVYKDKIEELWGRKPLDLYSCTEGGVIATQVWDYDNMTFVPNINLLEFIPEEEHYKWQMDRSYQPKTVLLDEVQPGNNYEIVITNFHGGALLRYRLGDMIRIRALRNSDVGIELPQMTFERRVDDVIDFNVIRVTEKSIWHALEKSQMLYEDWFAYRVPGQQTLVMNIEPKGNMPIKESEAAAVLLKNITVADDEFTTSSTHEDLMKMVGFNVEVRVLPVGTFANYMREMQANGADLAHIKPPHVNPSKEIIARLTEEVEETIVVTKTSAVFKAAESGSRESIS